MKTFIGTENMAEYDLRNFIRSFTERSIENYCVINNIHALQVMKDEEKKKELLSKVFTKEALERTKANEFTQYINSLFGLIIIPHERFKFLEKKEYNKRRNYIATTKEYLKLQDRIDNLQEFGSNYGEEHPEDYDHICCPICFIKHLRNSLAHNRTLFLSENKELSQIMFYDRGLDTNNKASEFCLKLGIEELKELVADITNFYMSLDFDSKDNESKYNNKVLEREEILKRLKCK